MNATNSADDTQPFGSLGELRKRHEGLLAAAENQENALGSVPAREIEAFIAAAAKTGSVIDNTRDRREAQGMITFWAAELIRRGSGTSEWTVPRLAPATPRSADRAEDAASTAAESKSAQEDADLLTRSRALVRISASARQWMASGDSGWLLTGDALDEAETYIGDDQDIRSLVAASRVAERKKTQTRWVVSTTASVILLALCIALAVLLQKAMVATEDERAQRERAEEFSKHLDKLNSEQAEQARRLQGDLEQLQAEQTRRLQADLDRLLANSNQLAEVIRKAREAGRIRDDEIPPEVRTLIGSIDQPPPQAVAPPLIDAELARGYNPDFLQSLVAGGKAPVRSGIAVPLPRLSDAMRERAHNGGRPVDYVNFSLILDRPRRMAVLAAVNLRRSAVIPLLRANVQFQFDVRVPREIQLDVLWFRENDFDRGHLVNAREIAWGPAFATDAVAASRNAAATVYVMTNVTPQYNTFNQGIWAQAERYARERFSPPSDRVTIFTGPVLADNDPVFQGVAIPQSFWKVLVTTDPANAANLVVEVYLIPQVSGGAKIPVDTPFDPNAYRVRLTEIERLTGLDFGEVLRAADGRRWISLEQVQVQATQGGRDPAARLQDVTAASEDDRKAAVQDILNALRDPAISDRDYRKLAEGLVALAGAKSFATLSAQARVNVLRLLREIPKERWDARLWIDLKAQARRAAADATAILGGCSGRSQSQACDEMAALKPKLDWDIVSGRTVYFQFAGMVREDAKALSDRLKTLGWTIPGEQRTGEAAGTNEVRWDDPGDEKAAELLAADLRALGRSAVKAIRAKGVKAKTPEIWVSI